MRGLWARPFRPRRPRRRRGRVTGICRRFAQRLLKSQCSTVFGPTSPGAATSGYGSRPARESRAFELFEHDTFGDDSQHSNSTIDSAVRNSLDSAVRNSLESIAGGAEVHADANQDVVFHDDAAPPAAPLPASELRPKQRGPPTGRAKPKKPSFFATRFSRKPRPQRESRKLRMIKANALCIAQTSRILVFLAALGGVAAVALIYAVDRRRDEPRAAKVSTSEIGRRRPGACGAETATRDGPLKRRLWTAPRAGPLMPVP
ncbi:hypothetical protein M885DRAFT_18142 [Pelagophyceae sp. CCMP2097]|nr:hypothetical protein M885DRAFT_18142 [Pelagophyceae sp. CCMP2097]